MFTAILAESVQTFQIDCPNATIYGVYRETEYDDRVELNAIADIVIRDDGNVTVLSI